MPRKNILEVGGLPMLAYPLRAARETGLFDRIFVSTEDAEIAGIAREYGAEIIQRPRELAEDRSTVAQVCLHILDAHPEIQRLCCLYATAILLRPESIAAAHALLDSAPEADFVMGVSEYEYSPVQALKTDAQGYLTYMWPEWRGVQSQNQPQLVVSNGSLYWVQAETFKAEKTFYGRRLKGYRVPPEQVTDIDTPADLERVRRLFAERT